MRTAIRVILFFCFCCPETDTAQKPKTDHMTLRELNSWAFTNVYTKEHKTSQTIQYPAPLPAQGRTKQPQELHRTTHST